jgi:ADP-ribosyl-[dinitrogen reductase] hydrolase
MKTDSAISVKERILGGLWGSLVGDALGVPVEFKDRAMVQAEPVTNMRGFGSHKQPPGTWSDDGSLTLCTVESLVNREFDLQDMGLRFVQWVNHGLWTAWGEPFDVGVTTSDALFRIADGVPAERAGGTDEYSNGNGSLMRILPVAIRFAAEPIESFANRLELVSAITHGHSRSRMACVLLGLFARGLLFGFQPQRAMDAARSEFAGLYDQSASLDHFRLLLEDDFRSLPEPAIASTGYVLHTLHASLWCLLTTQNFRECVLKAVNLGGDTDTTGCVAGGLAGILYGVNQIPSEWINALPRRQDLDRLFGEFVDVCLKAEEEG